MQPAASSLSSSVSILLLSLTTGVHALFVRGKVVLVAMAAEKIETFTVVGVLIVPVASVQEDVPADAILHGKMADFSWKEGEGGREGGREGGKERREGGKERGREERRREGGRREGGREGGREGRRGGGREGGREGGGREGGGREGGKEGGRQELPMILEYATAQEL